MAEVTNGSGWDQRQLPEWMKGKEIPEWMEEAEKPFKAGKKEIKPVGFREVHLVDTYLIDTLGEEPFFAGLFMQMGKVVTMSVPTMAVTFSNDQFTLLVNPEFVEQLHDASRKAEIISCLMHEGMHPIQGHLTSRWSKSLHPMMWNWATDMAINSMLVHMMKRVLPSSPILPGLRPGMPFDITKDPIPVKMAAQYAKWLNSKPSPLEQAVLSAPPLQSAEFYYSLLSPHLKEMEEGQGQGKYGWGQPGTDDHDVWMQADEESQSLSDNSDYLAERAKDLLRKATEHADNKGSWGNVPAEMQMQLRSLLSPKIDWREQLREWVGNHYMANESSSSWRRVHKKYPYQQPGRRRSRGIRLLIASDQSASVDNAMLMELLTEVKGMSEMAAITFIAFDTTVDLNSLKEWDAGEEPEFTRTRGGGTSFKPITEWANSDRNRDRFDAIFILTDGEAEKPPQSSFPRLWLLPEHKKLLFTTDDKVIHIPQQKKA